MERVYKICKDKEVTSYTVDVVHYLYYVIQTLKEKIGEEAFYTWSVAVKRFLANVIKSYCAIMESVCKNKRKFLPSPILPLLFTNRSKGNVTDS
jgi:hypothetical protein